MPERARHSVTYLPEGKGVQLSRLISWLAEDAAAVFRKQIKLMKQKSGLAGVVRGRHWRPAVGHGYRG